MLVNLGSCQGGSSGAIVGVDVAGASIDLRGRERRSNQLLDVKSASASLQTFGQRRSPTKRRSTVATHRQQRPTAADLSSSSSESSIVPRRTPNRSAAGECDYSSPDCSNNDNNISRVHSTDLLSTHLLTNDRKSPLFLAAHHCHSADEQLSNSGSTGGGGDSEQQLFEASADTAELVGRPNKAAVRSNRRINRLRAIGNQLK